MIDQEHFGPSGIKFFENMDLCRNAANNINFY